MAFLEDDGVNRRVVASIDVVTWALVAREHRQENFPDKKSMIMRRC